MHCAQCNLAMPLDARYCAACGKPIPGAAGPAGVVAKSSAWIVLLIVAVALGFVMIVGIIAAIAVPNLLNAIDRGKQKRTMIELRSVEGAIELYAQDHNAYPVASNIEELEKVLAPEYIRVLPMQDGWGRAIQVRSTEDSYELVSTGKDGIPDGCPGGSTTVFDADICFSDGRFTQWPEGAQR